MVMFSSLMHLIAFSGFKEKVQNKNSSLHYYLIGNNRLLLDTLDLNVERATLSSLLTTCLNNMKYFAKVLLIIAITRVFIDLVKLVLDRISRNI